LCVVVGSFLGLPLAIHVWTPFPPGWVLFAAHSCCVEVVGVLSLLLGLVIVIHIIQGTLIPCMFP
jgi:hypothetical protein